jgi:hypothetical protein
MVLWALFTTYRQTSHPGTFKERPGDRKDGASYVTGRFFRRLAVPKKLAEPPLKRNQCSCGNGEPCFP